MKNLIKWFKGLFSRSEEDRFNDGYAWGSRKLVLGTRADYLESFTFGSSDPFDKGINKALFDYHNRPPSHINCRCTMYPDNHYGGGTD